MLIIIRYKSIIEFSELKDKKTTINCSNFNFALNIALNLNKITKLFY